MNELHYHRKVSSPTLPVAHLHREVLVHQINRSLGEEGGPFSPYKLVLLHAPPGYGKTTLLADFARHTSLPCCWYFLDYTDTDSVTFLTILLMSIRQRFPDFGHALDPLLTSERANSSIESNYFDVIIETLLMAIETELTERFVLVLCNYQEVNERPEINNLLNKLLQKLPRRCVVVIESRVIPGLDFARLLAGQMIFGIGIDQLRFTAQQIHELAQLLAVRSFTNAEAEQVSHAFDGWIAGILLGTRLSNLQQLQQLQAGLLFANVSEKPGTLSHLFFYIANEVFKGHQKAYTFLKDACVLQEMPPTLCATLLEITPVEACTHLQYLERQNLFVTHRREGPDIVYACNPVLRKLFYEELRHETPERFSQLHQRAAALLSATHNYSQAIHHALEASVDDIAARLIIEATEPMTNQGYAETLARWIDAFPAATTKHYPKLLLIRANIFIRQGDYHSALPLLDAVDVAIQGMVSQHPSLETQNLLLLQAELAIARSKILFQQVEYQQSQFVCQQVLERLPVDQIMLRADAHIWLGLCSILLGDFTTGIAQIQKALQLWGRHTVRHQTADGHSLLASAYALLGNFALAEHHVTRAFTCWDQLQDMWGKIDNLIRLGAFKLWQGAFSEAESICQEALRLAQGPIHFLRGQAYALHCLGILYQRQERQEFALQATEEALALARQINDPCLVNDTLCALAMIYLSMGDIATAKLLISEVEIQTTSGEPIGYKRAIRDLVYGTIYLYQREYSQAWSYLSESEATFRRVGLKQEHLQALLRLADYYIMQDQVLGAIRCIETAATIATICEGYEQLAQMEVRHLPDLYQAIETLPEMMQARAFLSIKTKSETAPTHELPSAQAQPSSAQSAMPLPLPEIKVVSHKLTILALGEPAIYLQQVLVTRWRMACELFFYLLDRGRPTRKAEIIPALWPEVDEQTTSIFYSAIYYLRQALGGESVIVAKSDTYTLKLEALYDNKVWYDVVAFEGYRTEAKLALENKNGVDAKTSYLAMVDLYRGNYVQSFYSDWCTGRRDELRGAYLEACHQLAQMAWREEQFDESIIHWQQMLAIDNWLEEAHYGLMRCYARQDKKSLALRQYQCCKDTLEQEFGVAPQTSIQNLYQRLKGAL